MHFTTLSIATLSILASAHALPQWEKPESHFPPAPAAAPHFPAEPFHAAPAPTPAAPQGWGFGGIASKLSSEYSHISSAWSLPTASAHSIAWGPEPTHSQPAWDPEPTHSQPAWGHPEPTGHPGFPWGPEPSKTKTTMATVTTKPHTTWTHKGHSAVPAPTMTMGAKVNWKGHGKGKVDQWMVEKLAGY